MHRETISRSILYSHTMFGKSVIGTVSRNLRVSTTATNSLAPAISLHSLSYNNTATISSTSGNVRGYHKSWKNTATAQSVIEAKVSTSSSNGSADEKDPPVPGPGTPVIKQFNLKAKAILSTPDEPESPPRSSSQSGTGQEREKSNHNLFFTGTDVSSLDSKILGAYNAEELLNLSSQNSLTLKHACLLLSRLGSVVQRKGDRNLLAKVTSDKRFLRLFNLIQRGNHSQSPHNLLQALNGLQKLGLEESSEVSRLVERELSWSVRRCPLKFLAKSVRILQDNALRESATTKSESQVSAENETTVKDANILQVAIKVLHRRWIEAISGSEFIALFQVIELMDDERKLKIEERAADLVHQFSPPEILKMFIVLGGKKRRPTPLLRSLAYHYSKSQYRCNAKESIELIYSLNELTFAEPILMNKLCVDISEEILHVKNAALISSLMTSLGQMRYKQKDILLAVDEWISKHLDSLRVFDIAAWLQAAATLNYVSSNLPMFCKKAQQVLTQSTVSSPTEWVNIVHAFAVLSYLENDMLSSVLNPKFIEDINKIGPKASRQKVKILNLNSLAKKKTEYKGPLLTEGVVKDWSEVLVNTSDEKLSKLVVDSLATFLPPQKYLELNTALESGVFIDAKCFLDSKMIPVTLDAAKSKSTKALQKVAFVVEGYPSMCIGLKGPTGQTALNTKLLQDDDYVVVNVPYIEFGPNDKLVRRVQYLEQKLKAISQ